MKPIKRFISLVICVSLFALYALNLSAEDNMLKYNMTLSDFESIAEQQIDLDIIKNLEMQKESFEIKIDSTKQQITALKNEIYSSVNQSASNNRMPEVYALEKELAEYEFELSLFNDNFLENQSRQQLKSDILSAYVSLYYQNRQLEQSRETLNFRRFNNESQNTLYENGKVTKNAADIAKAQFESAQNTVKSYERSIPFSERKIAIILNRYDETNFSIIPDKPEKSVVFDKSEKQLIKDFLKCNPEILRLENKIKLEEEYLEKCAWIWGGEDSDNYKLQEFTIKQYKMQYEQTKSSYALAVSQKYAEYISLRDAYSSSLSYISTLADSKRINKVLFDEGEISKLEYMQKDLDYSAEMLSAEESYLNLIIAVEGLESVEMGIFKE
jgi:hypothetical protein